MEYRKLGGCGLRVPVLGFGTATFGGGSEFFKAWGSTDTNGAKRFVDICLEAGVTFFDTADTYSSGLAEEILGEAIAGKRQELILATKATFPVGEGINNYGSSRYHLMKACEDSLRRLKTDHIDLYYMHGFDHTTPVDETLKALEDLRSSGKIGYIGCSNFSGWHLMKSLSISEKYGWAKYVAHQVYYSLAGRDFEFELMPLAQDQNIGSVVWSPLAAGALSGKYRRGQAAPATARLAQTSFGVVHFEEPLYRIIDVLDQLAEETGKTHSQIALNWVLEQPTVSSLVIGARNEVQLKENLGALGWKLTSEQMDRLNTASKVRPVYPYWHQRGFPQLQTGYSTRR